MATIASLAVQLSCNPNQFEAGLQRAQASVQKFQVSIEQMRPISLDSAAKSTVALRSAAGDAASAFSTLASAATVAAAAVGGGSLVSWGIRQAANAEQAFVSFKVMLGSAEAARDMLGKLYSFASSTPFETGQIVQAARQLNVMGFSARDTIPLLTILGDAAAASGENMTETLSRVTVALGQMKSAGRVNAQDMMQLVSTGIPAWDALGKKLGTTQAEARKLVESGSVDAATGISAVLEAVQGKFSGMMAQQSQTFTGLWSTLKSEAALTAGGIAQSLMDGLNVKGGMAELIDYFQSLKANAATIGSQIAASLAPVLEIGKGIGAVFSAVWEVIKGGLEAIGGWLSELGTLKADFKAIRSAALDVFEGIGTGIAAAGDLFGVFISAIETGWEKVKHYFLAGLATIKAKFYETMAEIYDEAGNIAAARAAWAEVGEHQSAAQKAHDSFADMVNGDGWQKGQKNVKTFFDAIRAKDAAAELQQLAAQLQAVVNVTLGIGGGAAKIDVSGLDAVAGAMKPWERSVLELQEKLLEQRATIGMTADELVIYKLKFQGATDGALQSVRDLQNQIARLNSDLANQDAIHKWAAAFVDSLDPLQQMKTSIEQLNEALGAGEISEAQYLQGLGKAVQTQLQKDGGKTPTPGALTAGSKEAYSAVLQASLRKSPQDQLKAALKTSEELQKQQLELGKKMLAALEDNGFVVADIDV
jgi:tape measure domain-containing protein